MQNRPLSLVDPTGLASEDPVDDEGPTLHEPTGDDVADEFLRELKDILSNHGGTIFMASDGPEDEEKKDEEGEEVRDEQRGPFSMLLDFLVGSSEGAGLSPATDPMALVGLVARFVGGGVNRNSPEYRNGQTTGFVMAMTASVAAALIDAGYFGVKAAIEPVPLPESQPMTAEAAADEALAAGQLSGSAAELRVGGRTFTAVSGEAVPPNPAVTGALMGTPTAARAPWHGACAEIGCLDKALNAGVDVAGGSSRAVNIGASGSGHGTFKAACSSCADVLEFFGVSF